ncbi:hypothetical protein I7I48_02706 [Histoplasma ohiense]|nr:hypothetical protein I7I48_02706 [Histoplasma ohiense (nom. inval.)]
MTLEFSLSALTDLQQAYHYPLPIYKTRTAAENINKTLARGWSNKGQKNIQNCHDPGNKTVVLEKAYDETEGNTESAKADPAHGRRRTHRDSALKRRYHQI